MKLNVKKFAELCGVSVRTLHYYDEIGLLKPDKVDELPFLRRHGVLPYAGDTVLPRT